MTGKQRAYLRSLANTVPAKYQIGKNGFSDPNFLQQLEEGLEKNELVKITVLENAGLTAREASDAICEKIGAVGVQAIGRKIVLYKESKENRKIILP